MMGSKSRLYRKIVLAKIRVRERLSRKRKNFLSGLSWLEARIVTSALRNTLDFFDGVTILDKLEKPRFSSHSSREKPEVVSPAL